jgi:hypothetical protein
MSHFARFMTAAALTMTALATPALALDGADGYVFVPNRGSADVAVIDTRPIGWSPACRSATCRTRSRSRT